MVKKIDIQVQEAQRVPNKLDPKRTTPRHILIKMPKVKDKERILKAAREPWLVWLTWLEHCPLNQRVMGSVPSQGTCLGCKRGTYDRPRIHVTLLLKKIFLKKQQEKRRPLPTKEFP